MTISTSLLFDRSVQLMTKQQGDLASIQERVATGKELVRPSDSPELAVNIARIKSTIGQLDAYKNSLNSVNDRLRIEESYLDGVKDVLIKVKQLTLQGSNGTMTGRDREVIAIEIDELTAEIKNLANGTDANGNFVFGGSRVATEPFAEDETGIIRYQGDNYRSNIDYTSNRRSSIGRNGLDVFKPILSGQFLDPIPAIYELTLGGTLEPGDSHSLQIDGKSFSYEVRPGDNVDAVFGRLAHSLNEADGLGQLQNIEAQVVDGRLQIRAVDGIARTISSSTTNGSTVTDDVEVLAITDSDTAITVASLSGTMERGDAISLSIGARSMTYHVTGDEGSLSPTTPEAVLSALKEAAESSGLFSQSVSFELTATEPAELQIQPLRENIGVVSFNAIERTNINDQTLNITMVQKPTPPLPERIEFFEALQEVSSLLRTGTQDQVQAKLDHLDQMIDISTLSLADIGAEMNSINNELSVNDDIKLQLEATLAGKEDLDYASAITELQAKMMSLEAAQSSFAKISQLSLFDYIR
jgi:flagellar hook-associated protein 3 FlgL